MICKYSKFLIEICLSVELNLFVDNLYLAGMIIIKNKRLYCTSIYYVLRYGGSCLNILRHQFPISLQFQSKLNVIVM